MSDMVHRSRAARLLAMAGAIPLAAASPALAKSTEPRPSAVSSPLVTFRSYQLPVFKDHSTKVLILEWSRQIGKSYTLANWCVSRLLRQLQRHNSWLITVLSNSKANGAEFAIKAAEAGRKMMEAAGLVETEFPDADTLDAIKFDEMKFEIRLRVGNRLGRILVLAANPRTARGFSGDLILDEFAFHEKADAIWEAAEPIISANPEFLCRIASTHNGKGSLFNQFIESGSFPVNSVRRSDAWRLGEVVITSLKTGRAITPEEAEAEAVDKRAYRQNYENEPGDSIGALLAHDDIVAAQRVNLFPLDEDAWSASTLQRLYRLDGELSIGQDFGREQDLSVVTVLQRSGEFRTQVAQLVMRGKDTFYQFEQMRRLVDGVGPKVRRVVVDCTGNGTGLADLLERQYGSLALGVNFSTTVPVTEAIKATGRKAVTMSITEKMGLELQEVFVRRQIAIHDDRDLYNDLRKPGRVVSADGKRVSIAARRDSDGHADRFWALALAEHGFNEAAGSMWTAEDTAGIVTGDSVFGGSIITDWG